MSPNINTSSLDELCILYKNPSELSGDGVDGTVLPLQTGDLID